MAPRSQDVSVESLRHHGDIDAAPGLIDFAVNVHGAEPPVWLQQRLAGRIGDLARYPSADENSSTRSVLAERHRRSPDEVLLLAGAAEGFSLLPNLDIKHAVVIHPSFTEPEFILRRAGIRVTQLILREPFTLGARSVPDDADLVVLGNPTNPTSVLHTREDIDLLRRPGRIVVVDEAFMDVVQGEHHSFSTELAPDVVVLRSITKTWALAGLRCGYALGDPEVLTQLGRTRPHWPVGSLQMEALRACSEPAAQGESLRITQEISAHRDYLVDQLRGLVDGGIRVLTPASAPFVLVQVPSGLCAFLRTRGIAVRRCDTFPGLSDEYVRVAVRAPEQVDMVVNAMKEML
ncbi:threonine-phosphate decarboxylase [Hoyosella rhizosphaerae]|nr:threonine-phosphate decarboxylase [Hoyosella rhizosphaerae]